MMAVYTIPPDITWHNVLKSKYTILLEGDIVNISGARYDNNTDSMMLLAAGHERVESIHRDALNIPVKSNNGNSNPVLKKILINEPDESIHTTYYQRYWHGYMVYLKPLLCFFHYENIRNILSLIQIVLVSFIVYELLKIKKGIYSLGIIGFYIFLNPIAMMGSLQYTNVFLATCFGVILVICKTKKWEIYDPKWIYLFLLIGVLTSFLDLLTYPLASIGIPLILWISLNLKNESFLCYFFLCCRLGLSWFFGYACFWITKWILATAITEDNIILNGISAASGHMKGFNSEGITYTIGNAIKSNLLAAEIQPAIMIIVICVVILALFILIKNISTFNITKFVIYFLISCLPFIWYIFVTEHSCFHFWMTYRDLSVTFFALIIFVIELLDRYRNTSLIKNQI